MDTKPITRLFLVLAVVLLTVSCGAEKKDFIDRMEIEHEDDKPVQNASANYTSVVEVTTENVQYATVDGNDVTGYLAQPENAGGELPGLIVIHEWWGLNDNIRMMTRRLAEQGYKALAVDLYNGESADTPEKAGNLARKAGENPELGISNLNQAYAYLTDQQNATNIGTIGWCFGGGWSLRTALALPEKVDATVIYYGRLVTDTKKLKKLQMPILGIFGAEDSGIPPKEVKKFESALDEVGVTNSIHIYDGAGHAFANPSGDRYVKKAAEDAWKKTTSFFEKHLK